MDTKKRNALICTAGLAFMHLLIVLGFRLEILVRLCELLVPVTILATAIVLFLFHRKAETNNLLYGFVIFSGIFIIEIFNGYTGLVFGHFIYGSTLGLKLFGIPLMTGVYWLMLNYCCCCIAARTARGTPPRAFVASILMVIIDIFLEPVAADLRLWDWPEHIPFQNYVAWFAISFLFSIFFFMLDIDNKSRMARKIYLIQLLFLIALNLN